MQDLTGCDYFRTPVIFQVPDIYRFVGAVCSCGIKMQGLSDPALDSHSNPIIFIVVAAPSLQFSASIETPAP